MIVIRIRIATFSGTIFDSSWLVCRCIYTTCLLKRQFRATTRLAALAALTQKKEADSHESHHDDEDDDGDLEEDEELRAAAEAERLRLEEERLRIERENPPELMDLRKTFEECVKKYHKLLKVFKKIK